VATGMAASFIAVFIAFLRRSIEFYERDRRWKVPQIVSQAMSQARSRFVCDIADGNARYLYCRNERSEPSDSMRITDLHFLARSSFRNLPASYGVLATGPSRSLA
jgi:hypothetical protein